MRSLFVNDVFNGFALSDRKVPRLCLVTTTGKGDSAATCPNRFQKKRNDKTKQKQKNKSHSLVQESTTLYPISETHD